MIVKLLTEHHLEFLSLTGRCRGSSESKLVKMSNCWKSHATAHFHCKPPFFHCSLSKQHSVGVAAKMCAIYGCWNVVFICLVFAKMFTNL